MAWDFSTEPEFEKKLEWMRQFVTEEIMPLETLADRWREPGGREAFARVTAPLKERVKEEGLWAAHLPPDMGGKGFGQVKLGLIGRERGGRRNPPPFSRTFGLHALGNRQRGLKGRPCPPSGRRPPWSIGRRVRTES